MPNNKVEVGDNDFVTRVALAEAASEGRVGLQAVLAVTANRARQTGLTMEQVMRQRGQYEPTFTEAGQTRMRGFRPGSTQWLTTQDALQRVLNGEDPTNGADHFFSPKAQAAAGRAVPAWARSGGQALGNHTFFKLGYGNRDMSGSDVPQAPRATATPNVEFTPLTASEALAGGRRGSGALTADQILGGASVVRLPRASQDRMNAGEAFAEVSNTPAADRTGYSGAARTEAEMGSLSNANQQRHEDSFDWATKLGYAARQNSVVGSAFNALTEALDNGLHPTDPNFNYEAHMDEIEDGRSIRQVDELRQNTGSLREALDIRNRQDEENARMLAIGDGASGMAYNLAGGILDPAGAVIGLGVGKGFQLLGVGSRILATQGSRVALTASMAGEGALGNVLATGAMDALGTYTTPNDYAASAAFGAGLGIIGTPFVSHGSTNERMLQSALNEIQDAAARDETSALLLAQTRAGPDATPERIATEVEAVHNERATAIIDNISSPVPVTNMLMVADHTPDPKLQPVAEELASGVSDDAQRNLVAMATERAIAIDAANPVTGPSDALEGLWLRTGMASTGLTMSRSKFAPLRGIAAVLSEGTQGQSGRRHSAALEVVLRETDFNRALLGWNSNFDLFRKSRGVGILKHAFGDGNLDREFNELVALEMRNRSRPDLYASSQDPSVVRAADILGTLYKRAGEEQVRWQTVGSENIKPGDASYFPQMVSAEKIKRLQTETPELLNEYRSLVAEQARTIFGWDKKFADYFGKRYIETAARRASGGYDTPANLAHHQAGEIVQDILTSMREGASKEDIVRIDKESAAFARGGPSFTKGRLDFDVTHAYKSKRGKEIRLLDIMESDMLGLARRYTRRAAGEIALQKFGIQGKHGLDVLRKVVEAGHLRNQVTDAELDAFDQLVSEIINVPWAGPGGKNIRSSNMENLRLITSAIKLGGMGITQFGETGNGFAAVGVARTMDSIAAMPRLIKELDTIRKGGTVDGLLRSIEIEQGFDVGLHSYIMDRAFDVADNNIQLYGRENLSIMAKASRGMSHLQAVVSGQRMITAIQTRGMSEQIIHKALTYIRDGKEDIALKDMGFDEELTAALRANMDKIATFDGKTVSSLNVRGGGLTDAQVAKLVGVVNRGASQIIQTVYPGETGKWAHSDLLKLLFQFRTFSMTSIEKQWGRNVKNYNHLGAAVGLLGAMSFAFPIHLARVYAKTVGMSEEKRKEYLDKNLNVASITQATLNYASAAGLAGDIWDIGGSGVAGVMGEAAPDWLTNTINPRGTSNKAQLLGGTIAPSLGTLQDAFQLARGDWKKVFSVLPGGSLPALLPVKNVVEDTLSKDEDK